MIFSWLVRLYLRIFILLAWILCVDSNVNITPKIGWPVAIQTEEITAEDVAKIVYEH